MSASGLNSPVLHIQLGGIQSDGIPDSVHGNRKHVISHLLGQDMLYGCYGEAMRVVLHLGT